MLENQVGACYLHVLLLQYSSIRGVIRWHHAQGEEWAHLTTALHLHKCTDPTWGRGGSHCFILHSLTNPLQKSKGKCSVCDGILQLDM